MDSDDPTPGYVLRSDCVPHVPADAKAAERGHDDSGDANAADAGPADPDADEAVANGEAEHDSPSESGCRVFLCLDERGLRIEFEGETEGKI